MATIDQEGITVELVRREAEGIVLEGFVWHTFAHQAHLIVSGAELHMQATPFRVQPWLNYAPQPDSINGTCCLLADHEQNGCLILSSDPIPPDVPAHWTCQPADLPMDWTHDDGEWKLALEAPMGSVPFSRCHDAAQVIFGGDEVTFVRVHANKSAARLYLWLCCEGWGRFGAFCWLRLEDDRFVDDTGNIIAVNRGDHWQTPGRFAGCRWHSPLISTDPRHPHQNTVRSEQ